MQKDKKKLKHYNKNECKINNRLFAFIDYLVIRVFLENIFKPNKIDPLNNDKCYIAIKL